MNKTKISKKMCVNNGGYNIELAKVSVEDGKCVHYAQRSLKRLQGVKTLETLGEGGRDVPSCPASLTWP